MTTHERVITELAASRGFTLEGLREGLRRAGRHETAHELLEAPTYGFGNHIEEVLGPFPTEDRWRLAMGFMETFMERRKVPTLKHIIETLDTIAANLERLVVLKEYELGVRLEDHGHGPYVPAQPEEE